MSNDPIERNVHLDKRAGQLAAEPGDDDELLSTKELASWLGVSQQWVNAGRCKGFGPPYLRMTPTMIRYRRGAVREWLAERTFIRTAAYSDKKLTPEHKAKISAAYRARQAQAARAE